MSAAVSDLALRVGQLVLDDADRHPEEAVDSAHPLRVATGQVVVDRDDVDALAFERVEIRGQRRDEGLALAGLHLGDLAAVQHHAANELDVVVPHVEHAPPGLAHDGEGFGQQVVQRRAAAEALLEFRGLAAKLGIGERLDARLELVDRRNQRRQPLELTIVLRANDLGEKLT